MLKYVKLPSYNRTHLYPKFNNDGDNDKFYGM